MVHEKASLILFIVECVHEDWDGSEEDIVELEDPQVVKELTREAVVEAEPKLRHHENYVLIEVIQH